MEKEFSSKQPLLSAKRYINNSKTLIQLHLKQHRIDQIDRLCKEHNITRPGVIRAILDEYFADEDAQTEGED